MTSNACPECGGVRTPDDPRGVLYFRHARGCTLDAAELQTQCADDARRWTDAMRFPRQCFDRDVTPTEAQLLTAVGLLVTDDTRTVVEWVGGIRRRTWPGIAPIPPPPPPEPAPEPRALEEPTEDAPAADAA